MKHPWRSREAHLLPSTVEAIGSTPLVELSRLTEGLNGRILAKLEYLNPGFSKKDRIARQMIEDVEKAACRGAEVKHLGLFDRHLPSPAGIIMPDRVFGALTEMQKGK